MHTESISVEAYFAKILQEKELERLLGPEPSGQQRRGPAELCGNQWWHCQVDSDDTMDSHASPPHPPPPVLLLNADIETHQEKANSGQKWQAF